MEYETGRDPRTGKIKPEERLTPARRYSYLVGAEEMSHRAGTRSRRRRNCWEFAFASGGMWTVGARIGGGGCGGLFVNPNIPLQQLSLQHRGIRRVLSGPRL